MMAGKTPRILLAAASSGSGKTLLTCGLLEAWKQKGVRLASFKCGPDYIDPMFHRSVLDMESRNLDSFFTEKETLRFLLERGAGEADLSVIEGVMGYFDGLGGMSAKASTYEVAALTETPVVLIVNCRGMSLSAVPLIKGFLDYEKQKQIRGIVLNQVSPMIYEKMKALIEAELPVKVYGYVPRLSECFLESRHLGLKRPDEIEDLKEKLSGLAEVISETVDLAGLYALGETAPPLCSKKPDLNRFASGGTVRIAVARDEAFNFYYADNLQLLEDMGAELLPFSPLRDETLPDETDGMLLGGGYPELYAGALSENTAMLSEIKNVLDGGLPCLAECGGFLYLHETLEDGEGKVWPMAGVIKGHAYRTPGLSRFGYVTLTAKEDTIAGRAGERFPAHEFHYWDSTCNGDSFLAEKPAGKRKWECMVNQGSLLAGFPHFYYYGNLESAGSFLKSCREFQRKKRG
ncbi:cobyrinate a,c-diamide synthase [Qiania dongpingensis]|nr:cobyrinate a,c-diamide synthase [Qiania dongpingensis]